MIDDILQKRPKKHVKDLNIVPILDMLTTVIFFLLMSTSFIEYTKLTLPPASTSSAPIENKDPPVAPRIQVSQAATSGTESRFVVRLSWAGANPGQNSVEASEKEITEKTQDLLKRFSQRYPKEKTLQVSMGKLVEYQALISIMDGARDYLPDVVLTAYTDN